MSTYQPSPIPTDHITLSAAQQSLIESLSANAHEIWAAQRMADGWTFGKMRDDRKKEHPCLVPYDELPESEKVYDRVIVEQTIKAALAHGYSIIEPD